MLSPFENDVLSVLFALEKCERSSSFKRMIVALKWLLSLAKLFFLPNSFCKDLDEPVTVE